MKEKRAKYVELYTKAINENPRDPFFYFLLGNRIEELSGLAEALPHYVKAHELGSQTTIGIRALAKQAEILFKLKRLPEALKTAQQLIALDSQNISARNVLASICLVTGQLDEAIKLSTEALTIKASENNVDLVTTKALPNFLLGRAYELKGEKTQAAKHYKLYHEVVGQ
jgi:tetratricopeptide (TPR) repeat protein